MRKLILGLLSTALCLQLQASSENTFPPLSPEGHVLVESAPLTHVERFEINEQRAAEKESAHIQLKSAQTSVNNVQAGTNYTSVHPGAYHHIYTISPNFDQFQVEDGSTWSTYPGDRHKMSAWNTFHDLVFVQGQDEFGSYMFKVINTSMKNSTVEVNMILGPIYRGLYTYHIIAIYPGDRKVVLSDYSQWDMSRWDKDVFKKWDIGQTIVIGLNDGSLTSFNPNILINVETLTYVRASLDK